MKRRAIDSSGQLLSPYDAYHDQIIKRKYINFKEQNQLSEEPSICEVINGQGITREHLLHHVGIENEQRLSILVNIATRQGIAKLLNHPHTIDQHTRILYYRWTRKISTLHPSNKGDQIAREFPSLKNVTHVITEISYGIDLLILFQLPSDIESIQMLDNALDTISERLRNDQGYQSMSQTDNDAALKRIQCPTVYSNLQDLQGLFDIDHILRRINESKRTTHLCSPIEYTMRAMTDFSSTCSLAFCIFYPLDPITCQRIEDYFNPWRHALRTLEITFNEYQQSSLTTAEFNEQIKEVKDVYKEATTQVKFLVISMRENGRQVSLSHSVLDDEKQRSEVKKIQQLTERIRSSAALKRSSLPSDRDAKPRQRFPSDEYSRPTDVDRTITRNLHGHRGVSAGRQPMKQDGETMFTSHDGLLTTRNTQTKSMKNNRALSQSRLESLKKSSMGRKPLLSTGSNENIRAVLFNSEQPYNPSNYVVDDIKIPPTQHRTLVSFERSPRLAFEVLGDYRARSPTSRPAFTSTIRGRTDMQTVFAASRGYPDTTSAYDTRHLSPSRLSFDVRDQSSLDVMMKLTNRKSSYPQTNIRRNSLTSLDGAPKIRRPLTKAVNLNSAYNDDNSSNTKRPKEKIRSRPSSAGSQRAQTTVNVRPQSVPTKRDQKDQPTTNKNATAIASTSTLEPTSKKARSRSSSPSREQSSLSAKNDMGAETHFQEETFSTSSPDYIATIKLPSSRGDQSDTKSTNQLAKRDDLKNLLRNPAFQKSTLSESPRLLPNVSEASAKSTTMDKIQTTSSKTAVDISIKVTPPILHNASHSAQDQSLPLQSIRPASPKHEDRPKILSQTLESPKSKEPKLVNILLFGQTGVGKSTFINAFANYLQFDTLERAETGKPLVIIPVSFIITSGFYFDERTITFGPQDPSNNENFNDQGHSVTQQCRTYTFDLPETNQRVCIIDTPGFGDTRGIEQDQINIRHINDYITNLPHVDAICCLFKPNESKIDILFRTCFMQLFSVIGENAYDKVMFCFTNSRSTFYAPGNTGPLLKKMLESVKNGQAVKMEKKNTFCFDNEAFRYLVARQNGVVFTDDEQQEYAKSWERSVQESKRLIHAIPGEKQRIEQIHGLLHPLLETIRNSLRNVILNQKNLSSDHIEVDLVKPEDISARCRKCPPYSEQINGFWINVDKPHYIDEQCISCDCPNKDHEQMKRVLRYRSKEQASQNITEMLYGNLDKLYPMVGVMTRFLKINSPDSFEDQFLAGLREMIEEETNLCRTKSNGELNQELSVQLQVHLKKYENEVKEMEKKGEVIDGHKIDEIIRTVKSLPLIGLLLEINQSSQN